MRPDESKSLDLNMCLAKFAKTNAQNAQAYIKGLETENSYLAKTIENLNAACGLMAGKIVALESIHEAEKPQPKRKPIEIELDDDVYVTLLEFAYTTKLSLSEIIENCLRGYFLAREK